MPASASTIHKTTLVDNSSYRSFAAKQPLVYLNLEFGDKYNDVVLALWELVTIFVFDPFLNKVSPRSSEFHLKHTMIAEIVCWDCV